MFSLADDATKHEDALETEVVDEVTAEVEVDYEVETEPASSAQDDEIENLKEQLLRTRADFDNFRRRTRQEKEELSQFATKRLLSDLLPVVDNFDRAMGAVSGSDDEQVKTGIEMVHRQLQQVLSQYGVKPLETDGQPFDPTQHEAVMQESVDGTEPGTVVQTLQTGYMLHDKVLRPAMVKVSV